MKIDGCCHCGYVRFRAEVDPATVAICHCADCQTLSGSAFRVLVPAVEGSFHMLSGMPAVYVKTAESGNRRRQAFCPQCGTPIYAGPDIDPQTVFVLRVGTISQRVSLAPKEQIWCRSAQSWIDHIDLVMPKSDKE